MDSRLIDCDFAAARDAAASECQHRAIAEADALIAAARMRHDGHAVDVRRLYASMGKAQRKRVTTAVLTSPWYATGGTDEDAVCAYLGMWQSLGGDALRHRLAEMLTSSASRTGWQERYQFSCLQQGSTLVHGLIDLPVGGDKALFLDRSGHLTGNRASSHAKSIDFVGKCRVAKTHEARVAIAAKYTEIDGGAQDNQARDLLGFADASMDVADARQDIDGAVVTILLCDGEYYGRRHANLGLPGAAAFRNEVRTAYNGKLVGCTDTAHFDIELGRVLGKLA